jgi:uncharacterized phage protein (TIGR01671 family)
MTKDRFRFRIPITNLDGVFDRFIFCDVYHEPIHFIGSAIFLTPEQCTGLKDATGRLIYEGDIVRVFYDHFNGTFTEKEVVGPVKWECGTWIVNNSLLNHSPEYDETHLESAAVEVIGNIHENPELLEANNGN